MQRAMGGDEQSFALVNPQDGKDAVDEPNFIRPKDMHSSLLLCLIDLLHCHSRKSQGGVDESQSGRDKRPNRVKSHLVMSIFSFVDLAPYSRLE